MKNVTLSDLKRFVDSNDFKEFADKVQAEYETEKQALSTGNNYCEITVYGDELYCTVEDAEIEPMSEAAFQNRVAGRKNVLMADRKRLEKIIQRLTSILPHLK